MHLIYSLGTSTREREEFLNLLSHYHLDALVDVRSFPVSRLEHFTQENLIRELASAGIDYFFLGKELGGFRQGGYEKYTTTTHYHQGLAILETIGRSKNTVFMCAERFPWKCHRRFIAKNLTEKGWKVVHIIDEQKVWEHASPLGT